MPINYEQKIVFIHIPKSGGSTFKRLVDSFSSGKWYLWGKYNPEKLNLVDSLDLPSRICPDRTLFHSEHRFGVMHHFTLQDIEKCVDVNNLLKQDFKFYSILRCPFDRLVSMYEYGKTRNLMNVADKTFEEWFYDRPVSSQSYRYLLDKTKTVPEYINIIDFNRLSSTLVELFKNKSPSLHDVPHEKKTERLPAADYFDKKMIDIMSNESMLDINYMKELNFKMSINI